MHVTGEIMELFDRSSSRNVQANGDDLFRLRIIIFDETAEIVLRIRSVKSKTLDPRFRIISFAKGPTSVCRIDRAEMLMIHGMRIPYGRDVQSKDRQSVQEFRVCSDSQFYSIRGHSCCPFSRLQFYQFRLFPTFILRFAFSAERRI
jgi:hypothetical protein